MTPNLILGLFPVTAPSLVPSLVLIAPSRPRRLHATVMLGRYHSAQGPVIDRRPDGQVTIDAGGRLLTGRPLGQSAHRSAPQSAVGALRMI